MEKKKEVGRGCFEQKLIGEKRPCRRWQFLTGRGPGEWISCRRCNVHLFLLRTTIDGPFLLTLLVSVTDISSCNGHGAGLCDSSPYSPLNSILVRFINFHNTYRIYKVFWSKHLILQVKKRKRFGDSPTCISVEHGAGDLTQSPGLADHALYPHNPLLHGPWATRSREVFGRKSSGPVSQDPHRGILLHQCNPLLR